MFKKNSPTTLALGLATIAALIVILKPTYAAYAASPTARTGTYPPPKQYCTDMLWGAILKKPCSFIWTGLFCFWIEGVGWSVGVNHPARASSVCRDSVRPSH